MSTIKVLPEVLVNKIAAGEVIERPASVVKELLENAADAGADRISVVIEEGGKQLVQVVDNGCGMNAEDCRLAVTPHATSKLSSEEDLFRIGTLGFRGEALASIGAVSNLRMVSRKHDEVEGAQIQISGEKIVQSSAVGCAPGTTVEVRDLFFNVPARRKFLRGASTESGHVTEQFTRMALANPRIVFELRTGSRVVHQLEATNNVFDRLAVLFGQEVTESLIPIDRDEHGLHIHGYAAAPSLTRSNAKMQYFFLNGRYIRDRFIQHAVREAYRGLMEHNRYPVVFLFLEIAADAFDVNVHPTKIEVRWQDSNVIHSQVLSVLRETFLRRDLTPALKVPPAEFPDAAAQQGVREQMVEYLKSAPPTQSRLSYHSGAPTVQPSAPPGRPQPFDASQVLPPIDSLVPQSPAETAQAAPPRAIQLRNTYLVTEDEDGLLIIDQHALHERIMYEQLRQRITKGALESQRLLLPVTVPATDEQMALLEENGELLGRLGVEVSRFGTDSVAVHSFPAFLEDVVVADFMGDLIDKLSETGRQPHTETLVHELLDMMACKAAVKAGDTLTSQEIESLIAQKQLVEKSSNCPHGRPTTLRFSFKDLEKQFKRT